MRSGAELARETGVIGQSPFTTPDSPMSMYELNNIVDSAALENEVERAIGALEAARNSSGDIRIIIKSSQDRNGLRRWQGQRKEVPEVKSLLNSLHLEHKEACRKAGEESGGVTTQEFCFYNARCAGAVFYLRSLLEGQRQYAQKQGFIETVSSYLDLQELCYTNGEASIRLKGVALKDFLDNDEKPKPPLSSLYSFLVRAFIVRHRRSYEEILRELVAQGYSWSVYPNITKQAIEGATAEAYALVNISPEQIDDLLRSGNGIAKESARWTARLYQRVQEVSHDSYQALLFPDQPESPAMRQTIRPYLEQGIHEKACALFIAGLRDGSRIRNLYRKAQKLSSADNSDFEFYQLLAESIKDYADAIPPDENILTLDDLAAIFDEEVLLGVESREAPTSESLSAIVQATFSKSSVKDYEVDPQSINWKGLVQPQSVRVDFNQDRPTKFRILLLYENEVGESLEAAFDFDTKRQHFDWNFIEAPSDARMLKFYEAALFASRSVLLRVQGEAERHYEEKQRERENRGQTETSAKKPKERFADEIYGLRKGARAQARAQNSQPVGLMIPEDTLGFGEIKKIILLPDDETLREKLKRLSFPDRQIAIEGIEKFNSTGGGEFRRKSHRGKDGSVLYALRINCSVPKGMRVLVREVFSSNGSRDFEILDIGYRGNIYQRAGI